MATIKRELVTHVFNGGRFDDHGVDLDVLPDLLAYKNILVETAKALWREKNPGKYLPRKFEDSLILKFYRVDPGGSAGIPLMREVETDGQGEIFENGDELDEAVELVAETSDAAGNDTLLPQRLPAKILPLFESYGKTLREGEYFEQRTAKRKWPAKYNSVARSRLMELSRATYEDKVDVIGTVTMARVSKPRFAVALSDGHEVEASFKPEEEAIVIAGLGQHNVAKLRLEGIGQFAGSGVLQRILKTERVTLLPSGELPFDDNAKPIWQVFQDIIREVPPEELEKLPKDGAENHDHYLYGHPRRSE